MLPLSSIFSTDLHSMGQYIQEGPRHFFQTTLWVEDAGAKVTLPEFKDQLEGYSYLNRRSLDYLNTSIFRASLSAHNREAGLPQIIVKLQDLSPLSLGHLISFFQISCALSGLLLGVDPFDQPGVEVYKAKMLRLLKEE